MLLPLNPQHIALLNPYSGSADMDMPKREALRLALKAQGVRLQFEILYTREGFSGGQRIALKDESGFFAEYCFSRENGLEETARFLRRVVDHNGHRPAFWSQES